ncbi:MAG: C2 domain-containing protein [Acidimicrobiales bacterium]
MASSSESLFPGIAAIEFGTEGSGPTLTLRLAKKEGTPVHLVPEGTAGATVVGVKRVNELDFYDLGHNDLAKKLGITSSKAAAAIWDQNIQANDDFFKEIQIGSSKFKRYSGKALQHLAEAIATDGVDVMWQRYRAHQRQAKKPSPPASASAG